MPPSRRKQTFTAARKRGIEFAMPTKTEALREELSQLKDDVKTLAGVIAEDPKQRKRKEWTWRLLYGALSAGFTIAGRRLAGRIWWVLTGRTPPAKR